MDPAQALRAQLRADLLDAMKTQRPQAVAALRTTIAAIDNAEAVDAPGAVTFPRKRGCAGAAGSATLRRMDGIRCGIVARASA